MPPGKLRAALSGENTPCHSHVVNATHNVFEEHQNSIYDGGGGGGAAAENNSFRTFEFAARKGINLRRHEYLNRLANVKWRPRPTSLVPKVAAIYHRLA